MKFTGIGHYYHRILFYCRPPFIVTTYKYRRAHAVVAHVQKASHLLFYIYYYYYYYAHTPLGGLIRTAPPYAMYDNDGYLGRSYY